MYESTAVEDYEKDKNVSTKACGLFVSLTHPYIAASPDRLLGSDTVIEVKCPHSAKDQMITNISVPWLKIDDKGDLEPDRKHAYYHQIQV